MLQIRCSYSVSCLIGISCKFRNQLQSMSSCVGFYLSIFPTKVLECSWWFPMLAFRILCVTTLMSCGWDSLKGYISYGCLCRTSKHSMADSHGSGCILHFWGPLWGACWGHQVFAHFSSALWHRPGHLCFLASSCITWCLRQPLWSDSVRGLAEIAGFELWTRQFQHLSTLQRHESELVGRMHLWFV